MFSTQYFMQASASLYRMQYLICKTLFIYFSQKKRAIQKKILGIFNQCIHLIGLQKKNRTNQENKLIASSINI
jgi:hypothetical protein